MSWVPVLELSLISGLWLWHGFHPGAKAYLVVFVLLPKLWLKSQSTWIRGTSGCVFVCVHLVVRRHNANINNLLIKLLLRASLSVRCPHASSHRILIYR